MSIRYDLALWLKDDPLRKALGEAPKSTSTVVNAPKPEEIREALSRIEKKLNLIMCRLNINDRTILVVDAVEEPK